MWKQFSVCAEERQHRLELALTFHTAAERVLQEVCLEAAALDEVDTCGKTLLDRLTLPVIFPDGTEQFFGSPSETAVAAEGVRERLLLVEERRLQLQAAGLGYHEEEEEEHEEERQQGVLKGQDTKLDVIGEELNERDEAEEDEELDRETQDC